MTYLHLMEQVKGIEPSQSAWKAEVLPLNYTCKNGASGRTWTGTGLPPRDFKSLASTISATKAVVIPRRFERPTHWLKVSCSTGWATEPNGWGSWIRTNACYSQSVVPYRLAIPHNMVEGEGFEPPNRKELSYSQPRLASSLPLHMVPLIGIEPTTFALQVRCSAGLSHSGIWWSQTGSNRRPDACKAPALPAELWLHNFGLMYKLAPLIYHFLYLVSII